LHIQICFDIKNIPMAKSEGDEIVN